MKSLPNPKVFSVKIRLLFPQKFQVVGEISFLYYSNKEFNRDYSTKNCGVVYDINNLIIQVDGEGLNEIPTQKDVFLVGIELPGTEGQLRIVEKQLIENEYNLISETTFDDGMKLLQFKMRDS